MIELKRSKLLNNLKEMSQTGSLLVVGGPGTGKSWLLRNFAIQRQAEGDAVLLLLAEEHNYVESLRQLEESLNISAGLISTLRAYPGVQKFLIIDSLDALRAEGSQRVFRQLIRQVHRELPEWKVVASIRSFDANESVELRQLFPSPNGLQAGLGARHLIVPVFNDDEIAEAKKQDVRLVAALKSVSPPVQEMLRNAFNLWLVIRLLDEKVELDWLNNIESDIQLFERYWYYRVSGRNDSFDRQSILRDMTSEMVGSRTLSVPIREAYKLTGASQCFRSLLSDEVLRVTKTQRIAYAHNILFDFSISKLLLDDELLFDFLRDPGRSIFFRPSVSYYLSQLWHEDRERFWNVALGFFSPSLALSARLQVLPGMAVFFSANVRQDFDLLLALEGKLASDATLSILRAVQAFGGLTGRRATLWLGLIVELSSRLEVSFLNEYLALIEIASTVDRWTREESVSLVRASIRLLEWMWSEAESNSSAELTDQLLSIAAGRVIPVITRLYSVDILSVRAALRLLLGRIGRSDVSPSEAYSIASNLDVVIDSDPCFAVDVYEATFAHRETSQETTQLGGSKVLVLTSTRAQDYSMAYYILGVRYQRFLDRDLGYAAIAAIRAVSGEIVREHRKTASKIGGYSARIELAGVRSRLLADRSELWDQGFRDSVALQMLDGLLSRLAERLKNGSLTLAAAWDIFRLMARENRFPVVWKRILEQASHNPELLPFAAELLKTSAILIAPETTVAAGELINRSFTMLSLGEKQAIEDAIWRTTSLPLAKMYRDSINQRDRLLGCIPENNIQERSKEALEVARAKSALLENKPFFKVGTVSAMPPPTNEEWLSAAGADPHSPPNRSLLDAKRPLAAFAGKYLNGVPSPEECDAITPALRTAYERVNAPTEAEEQVITDVFATITAVAKAIVRNGELDRESAVLLLCRKIIAGAAKYPYPEASANADEQFDTPIWGSTPKIEAAEATMNISRNWGLDNELERLIRSLSGDKSPAVRFQIANRLGSLYERDTVLFWDIANSMLAVEKATGVLAPLTQTVGHIYIAKREPNNVVKWFRRLLKRGMPSKRPEDVLQAILGSLTYMYVYLGNAGANVLIRSLEKSPLRYARHLSTAAISASYYLTYNIETEDLEAAAVRERARTMELRVLAAADRGFHTIEERAKQVNRGAAKSKEAFSMFLMAADGLVRQLHLIVKAKPALTRPDDKQLDEASVRKFFDETSDLWDAVVCAGLNPRRPMLPSTAHNLMEAFNRLLPFNAERILYLVWWLITGRTFGYQFDSMAISEFVRFAEKMLADNRELLRREDNSIRFAEILDVFVNAGWPQATEIVMRMDAAVR